METNKEGLTWCEWTKAAKKPLRVTEENVMAFYEWRNAWRNGEDPADWRANPICTNT